ncbi:isochorismate synthase, partial [Piscicoccus intestinalis]|uniref:isochorismate synthase n=1 Tax=Piscicoccus intestinalis TaxID=746033 RepID=UPI001C3F3EE0
ATATVTAATAATAATASSGSAAVPPEATDEQYQRAVSAALERIAEGSLRKVVLARRLEVHLRGLDAGAVWARLAVRNPHGYTFAVREGADVFLGASPELVAAIDDSGFATHPLAGSAPRGDSAARDAARGSALLASQKDRREHGFVVDHIVARLAPLLGRLDVPSAPGLFATDAMLHLGTRVTGALRPGVSCLEAALTIHPTPAVCGVPTARALHEIRRLEPAGRDGYAGLVGCMDARGHGQWALALRCALLRDGRARLYAGAGVVAGSAPEAEHAETAAKFATMTAALAPAREASTPAGGPR